MDTSKDTDNVFFPSIGSILGNIFEDFWGYKNILKMFLRYEICFNSLKKSSQKNGSILIRCRIAILSKLVHLTALVFEMYNMKKNEERRLLFQVLFSQQSEEHNKHINGV